MRNSIAVRAGVPAPFDNLDPLRIYLYLLQEVVAHPNQENLEAYITYDRDSFTPVACTGLSVGYRAGEPRSCVLYDGVEVHARLAMIPDKYSPEYDRVFGELIVIPTGIRFTQSDKGFPLPELVSKPSVPSEQSRQQFGSEAGLKNSARGVVNHLVDCVASSGAFPAHLVGEAYEMLDGALITFAGHDPEKLAFARKRMRLGLLNVWVQETQWRDSPHTADHREILQNVKTGWKLWGAPYGVAWIARMAGRLSSRSF